LAEPLAPQPDAASHPLDDPPGTIRLRGSVERADVADVCARESGAFATSGAETVACDLQGVENPALPIVDVLARLALVGRRSRHRMRLEHASPAILELLALCGLTDILAESGIGGPDSGGEVRR
jgi:ABC-type transporter Mla MlaB component